MVSHVFTTPVGRSASGLGTDDLRVVLEDLRALRKRETGEQRSNRGGWHSSGNLFALQTGPAWQALQAAVTRALFDYIGAVFSYSGRLELALVAWAVINRPGHFNLMHNHASHLLSGALYLSVPEGMQGGEIYFQDPRLNLNAHETEAMRQIPLLPPWHTAGVSVTPAAGEILIFPSWLMHAVHPFTAEEPEAERAVLSFNATV